MEKAVEKRGTATTLVIEVVTKGVRKLRFLFDGEDKEAVAAHVFRIIDLYAFPQEDKLVFAFSHKFSKGTIEGWEVFMDIDEYRRMGIDYETKVFFNMFLEGKKQRKNNRIHRFGCLWITLRGKYAAHILSV